MWAWIKEDIVVKIPQRTWILETVIFMQSEVKYLHIQSSNEGHEKDGDSSVFYIKDVSVTWKRRQSWIARS